MSVESNSTVDVRFQRLAGLAGIVFVLVIVGANLILVPAGLPTPGTDAATATAFFAEHRGLLGIAMAPTPLAWFCAVLFGAGVLRVLWSAERAAGTAWSVVGFAGLLLQNATFTVIVGIRYALGSSPDAGALWALQDALLALNGTFLALALVGLTIAGRIGGLVARWHAALGFAAAALQFTAAVLAPVVIEAKSPLGLIGLTGWLLWAIWFAAYGIALLRTAPDGRVAG
ncbi:hypothetical protein [Nocardia asteroides]|uniref:hypothetical protein n=1 Tax=Nocardia asteroides TaxID=1824 RepID=UPI001E52B9DF|nr:hypothetical protein [Nocardia asteroides]UGT54293.1 hypothetical protein LTT85_27180 [Nocardia asteroides]